MPYRLPALAHLDWRPVGAALLAASEVALLTHVRADTDGIGSQIALHRWLTGLGKDVRIRNAEPADPRLLALDPARAVRPFEAADGDFVARAAKVVLDVSERERLGPLAAHVARGGTTICIDHHVNDQRRFADLDVIEPAAPSTGVLVAELLQSVGAAVDPVIAAAIYATIVADTGSFRFSNTSSEVMRLAADLIDLGADPQRIHRCVLGSYSPAKLQLLSRLLAGVGLECGGRLAWFPLSRDLLAAANASDADSEGLVEYLRLLQGVSAAILLVEQADRRVKVSFRSEDGLDVNRLAGRWGGGGHRHAAGATLAGPLEKAAAEVVAAARESLFG